MTSEATLSGVRRDREVGTGAETPLRPGLLEALQDAVGADGVITDPGALLVYEADGLTAYRARPRRSARCPAA